MPIYLVTTRPSRGGAIQRAAIWTRLGASKPVTRPLDAGAWLRHVFRFFGHNGPRPEKANRFFKTRAAPPVPATFPGVRHQWQSRITPTKNASASWPNNRKNATKNAPARRARKMHRPAQPPKKRPRRAAWWLRRPQPPRHRHSTQARTLASGWNYSRAANFFNSGVHVASVSRICAANSAAPLKSGLRPNWSAQF